MTNPTAELFYRLHNNRTREAMKIDYEKINHDIEHLRRTLRERGVAGEMLEMDFDFSNVRVDCEG